MSASDKKKLRKEQNAAAMTQKQQSAKKEAKSLKAYTFTFVIVMVLIVAIVIGVAVRGPINGLIDQKTHAVTVGDHQLSITDFSYYYIDAINAHYTDLYASYGSYAQYLLGFSVSKPLDEQFTETGASWAEYFMDRALENAKSVYALYDLAKAAQHTMTDEEKASLNETIDGLKDDAKDSGYNTVASFLKAVYGNGANEKSYKKYLSDSALANSYYLKYQDELEATYTTEMFREYEAGKSGEYNAYTFATYHLEVEDFLPELEEGVDEYTQEQLDAALAAAKAAAQELKLAAADGLEAFEAAIKGLAINKDNETASYTLSDEVQYYMLSYESINDDIIDWLSSEDRKDGDIETFEDVECTVEDSDHVHETEDENDQEDSTDSTDSTDATDGTDGTATPSSTPADGAETSDTTGATGTTGATDDTATSPTSSIDSEESDAEEDACMEETVGFYVVCLTEIGKNQMKLVNVRHILVEFPYEDLDEDGNPTEAEKNATKAEAEALLADWEAGDKSEDSFSKLATEKTDDTASAADGGLYEEVYPGQMVEAFSDWCFDESRKEKDYGIVETDYGYHIIYFVSYCDQNFRDYMISSDILSEDMEEWYEGVLEDVTATKVNLKRMKWDITLSVSY